MPPVMLVPAALSLRTEVIVARHGNADSLGRMAEQALSIAPPRFALAGHSMGGRIALDILARAPQRVTRLALLDTGYDALSPGADGERERAGQRPQAVTAALQAWLTED